MARKPLFTALALASMALGSSALAQTGGLRAQTSADPGSARSTAGLIRVADLSLGDSLKAAIEAAVPESDRPSQRAENTPAAPQAPQQTELVESPPPAQARPKSPPRLDKVAPPAAVAAQPLPPAPSVAAAPKPNAWEADVQPARGPGPEPVSSDPRTKSAASKRQAASSEVAQAPQVESDHSGESKAQSSAPRKSRNTAAVRTPGKPAAEPRTTEPPKPVLAKPAADSAPAARPVVHSAPAPVVERPSERPEPRTTAPVKASLAEAAPSKRAEPASNNPAKLAALTPPTQRTLIGRKAAALTLSFAPASDELSPASSEKLRDFAVGFAERGGRLELRAYADAPNGSLSDARRLSLKRALAARTILLGQGIQSTRIDVRALGGTDPGGNPNRVDVVVDRPPRPVPASDAGTSGG